MTDRFKRKHPTAGLKEREMPEVDDFSLGSNAMSSAGGMELL